MSLSGQTLTSQLLRASVVGLKQCVQLPIIRAKNVNEYFRRHCRRLGLGADHEKNYNSNADNLIFDA